MKRIKLQFIQVLLILCVQIIMGFIFTYFTSVKWSVKEFVSNYVFITFWCSYVVCILGIEIAKKIKSKKDR